MKKKLPHNHGENLDNIIDTMNNAEDFSSASDIFKQLGDPSRLRLFWILCHCQECVTNLAAMMNMSAPAISHHLKQLKISGLITSHRDGKEVYYTISDSSEANALHHMIEQMISITCPSKK